MATSTPASTPPEIWRTIFSFATCSATSYVVDYEPFQPPHEFEETRYIEVAYLHVRRGRVLNELSIASCTSAENMSRPCSRMSPLANTWRGVSVPGRAGG